MNVQTFLVPAVTIGDIPRPYNVQLVGYHRQFTPLVRERAKLICRYLESHPYLIQGTLDYRKIYREWYDDKKDEQKLLGARCFLEPEDLEDYFQPFDGRGSEKNREMAIQYLKETGKKFVVRYCSLKDGEYSIAYSLTIALNPNLFEHYAIIHKIGDGYYFGIKATSGSNVHTAHSPIKTYPTFMDILLDQVSELKL